MTRSTQNQRVLPAARIARGSHAPPHQGRHRMADSLLTQTSQRKKADSETGGEIRPISRGMSLFVRHYRAGQQVCSCGCDGVVVPHRTKAGPARFIHGHNGRGDASVRFWEKVEQRGPDECWPWTARTGTHGYGQFYFNGGPTTAMRVAYQLAVGPIPEGLHIDHLCGNKLCVNPAHLEPVTLAENTRRYFRKQSHCKHGHALTDDNLYVRPTGRTECLTCVKARNKASWQRTLEKRAA